MKLTNIYTDQIRTIMEDSHIEGNIHPNDRRRNGWISEPSKDSIVYTRKLTLGDMSGDTDFLQVNDGSASLEKMTISNQLFGYTPPPEELYTSVFPDINNRVIDELSCPNVIEEFITEEEFSI